MYISELKLKNYRNYIDLNIQFSKNFNIIYGNNAQGKTNILEALFLCASGRSHRTSKDMELVNIGKDGYNIGLSLVKQSRESSIEIKYMKNEKKRVAINEVPKKKIGDLIGHLNVVMFSPEDIMIIKEGPSERRRFIDITISQLRPSYFYDLQQYARIMIQRNMLLKEMRQKKRYSNTIYVWNENLIKTGSRIIRARNDFLNRVNGVSAEIHNKLTDSKEMLEIRYAPSVKAESYYETDKIEKEFAKKIESTIERDIERCNTLYGPHRDDYEIFINGMNTKLYGSQGQQRTAVLSLKMSEIYIMREETGEYPVLLLDDVMSELDSNRQEYLLRNLENIQTIITCTDRSFFDEREKLGAKFFYVKAGKIIDT